MGCVADSRWLRGAGTALLSLWWSTCGGDFAGIAVTIHQLPVGTTSVVVTPSVNPGGTPGTSGSAAAPAFTPGAAAAGQVFVPMPPPSEEAFQPPAMTPVPPPKADGGKLGTWSVFFMILLVTTAVGLVDAWRTGAVGWITGAAFVVMCFGLLVDSGFGFLFLRAAASLREHQRNRA